jgi:hypothetical protein
VLPQTAFTQLLKSKTVGVDLCRTLIAKPASFRLGSFMAAGALGAAFDQARSQLGWFGGFANLDFEADSSGAFQQQAMQSLRQQCLLDGSCFCL